MNDMEFDSAPEESRPRTVTVVSLLMIAAAIFSYLGTYAVTNALVAVELLKAWPKDRDPRPTWFVISFAVSISILLGIFALARRSSARHARQMAQLDLDEG